MSSRMKTLAGAAALLLMLLVGATCGYAESTSLRCLRCGETAQARQLRLGPNVLLHHAAWAQRSIPLSSLEIETGPSPSTSRRCRAGHHLWLAGQTWKRGLFEQSGPNGTTFIAWR
jgi:hypothetical protein